MRGRVFGPLAIAIALSAMTAGGIVITQDGGAPEGTAHLWVDTSGGTCVDNASPIEYPNDGTECASLDAANQAAEAGDTVLVMAGTYADQNLTTKARSAPAVVMAAASGQAVVIEELDMTGVQYLTLRDMTVTPEAGGGANDKVIDLNDTDHVTFDNVDLDVRRSGTRQVRDGLGLSRNNDDFTYQNSDICCNEDAKLIQIQSFSCDGNTGGAPESCMNNGVTFFNNDIHTNFQSSSAVHMECIWYAALDNLLFDSNHVYDCALNGIVDESDDDGSGDDYSNWTWRNNIFERNDFGDGGGSGVEMDCETSAHTHSNWLWENNFISGSMPHLGGTCGGGSWITFRNNIGGDGDFTCGSATHVNNLWDARDCSASDVQDALDDADYVDAKSGVESGAGDYHASSCSSPFIDFGTTANYPTLDRDGVTRYLNDAPDAGPYEKAC